MRNEESESYDDWEDFQVDINFTQKQWDEYKEREVQLAMINLSECGASYLSSDQTIAEAKRRMGCT